MLCNIEIGANDTPDDLAKRFLDVWDNYKVFHITGLKLEDSDALREFYDAFMEKSGIPGDVGEDAISAADRDSGAQRTGQRWTEIRYDPSIEDAYRHSANPQPLHTDGSYDPEFPEAAIIYCQSSASNGGETIFIDYDDLVSSMKTEAKELLEKLQTIDMPHSRSGYSKNSKLIDSDNEGGLISWNYYCVDKNATSEVQALREEFHNYLQSSQNIRKAVVPVPLTIGEGVIWKDHRVLHGRNGFDPAFPSERFLWKSAFAPHNGGLAS
jgi:alpha-ketoglutarate-dependent taurine dioxygenase